MLLAPLKNIRTTAFALPILALAGCMPAKHQGFHTFNGAAPGMESATHPLPSPPAAVHAPGRQVPNPLRHTPHSHVRVAVLAGDASNQSTPGDVDRVEAFAESGISRAVGISLVSRRHLETVLAEQGLAYSNAVNERAKLGRLAGADILLLVSISENTVSRTPKSISAYGFTERTESVSSSAAISVKAVEVESGRILASRVFVKQDSNGPHALDQCAALMESALQGFDLSSSTGSPPGIRHKISVRPVSGGSEIPNLDLFIDGNFIGNTPIATDVEEGVRQVTLQRGGKTLWDRRIKIEKEVWLSPDLK